MKKFIKLLTIFFLMVITVFSATEKIVRIGLGYSGRSYDPHRHTDSSTLAITKQIYNNLFILSDKNEVVGELADKVSYDGNIIVIELKKNIFFQDGEELTAEIVRKSLERNKQIPVTKILVDPVEKIEILDKHKLKIYCKTNPDILVHNLSHSSLAIVKEDNRGKLVGTGAFKLLDWGTGEKVILEKNKKYFKGNPKVDKLEFVTIPEAPNRYIALETNEIQIAYDIASIDVKAFKESKELRIINELSYGTDFLSINTEKAPLNDKNLRKAIAYAIDKKSINEVIFENTSQVANSIITPNTFGYLEIDGIEYNLDKAKEIMKNYKKPINIDLWIYEDTSKYQMAQIIQANLKEIGIEVNIQTLELSSFLQLTAQGKHNALIGLWYTSTGDADYGYYPLLHNNSRGGVGNRSFYNNEKVNILLDEARKETLKENRLKKYEEIQKIVGEENPIIPIVYKTYNIGLNNSIKGFKFNPNGNHILENIEY
ncbi:MULTISPECIES: ABC transporter substrate-binding protein [Cetobacterium]|uniref:ABC transporter substrate-binding protein n=1 Tax=Candidatus Cetobacterium colombiensis TaxID=3073100 RepID=A0ABU4WCS1_9FUSO|nr:ABC transporter substrate-binding protein [Candidatus Cetobacterium colombiensis]MDX8337321.1 ABC transporter substrate-binding protein [Candidatus Cetobacterium colombiensis]